MKTALENLKHDAGKLLYWLLRLLGQFQVFFFSFLTKKFRAYKNTHKQTLTNKIKNKRTKNNKGNGFLRAQTSKSVKVA